MASKNLSRAVAGTLAATVLMGGTYVALNPSALSALTGSTSSTTTTKSSDSGGTTVNTGDGQPQTGTHGS